MTIILYGISCNQNMSSDSKRLKCSPYHHFKWPRGGFVLLDRIHLGSPSPEIHREGIFPLRHTEIFPFIFKLWMPLSHFHLCAKKPAQEATRWWSGNPMTRVTLG